MIFKKKMEAINNVDFKRYKKVMWYVFMGGEF